ncbi:MAG: helix-hairpin-helix domain-containing protein [Chloroflexota bacterium]
MVHRQENEYAILIFYQSGGLMISTNKKQRLQTELDKIIDLANPFPMTDRLALKIYRAYGTDSVARLTENPYTLARDVFGIGEQTATKIAEVIESKLGKQFSPDIPTKGADTKHRYCGPGNGKLSTRDLNTLKEKLHCSPSQILPVEWYLNNPQYWTLPDLKRAVKWWFNVSWAHDSSYRTLLKKCGLNYSRKLKAFILNH